MVLKYINHIPKLIYLNSYNNQNITDKGLKCLRKLKRYRVKMIKN